MVTILMMSAKMATPGLRKIKVFWKKGYDVIIFVNDVTNKILSRDSNHIVDVVTWPKFGNYLCYLLKYCHQTEVSGPTRPHSWTGDLS